MLDTIQLKIKSENKNIKYREGITKDNFGWINVKSNKGFTKSVRNATSEEKLKYDYLPQLEKVNRGFDSFLYITFSAPKLIYKNNLDELFEKDFKSVLDRLHYLISEIGISLEKEILRKATVNWIDFSKNIDLKNISIRDVLDKLNKIDISLRLDITEQQFRNKGSGFQIYSIGHSIVFYDKWSDLEKNKSGSKKSFDNYNHLPNYQRSIFDELSKKVEEYPNILRQEIRFRDSKKLKSILKFLALDSDLFFEDIFKEKISQTIVLYYFNKITEGTDKILFSKAGNETNLLRILHRIKPNIKTEKAIRYVGIFETVKKIGIRGLREITEKDYNENRKTWYRRKKEIIDLNELLRDFDNEEWFKFVKDSLQGEYKPFNKKCYD